MVRVVIPRPSSAGSNNGLGHEHPVQGDRNTTGLLHATETGINPCSYEPVSSKASLEAFASASLTLNCPRVTYRFYSV